MEAVEPKGNVDIYSMNYVRILRKVLWSVGAWPGKALGEKVPFMVWYHGKHLVCQTTVMWFGQVSYLLLNFRLLNFFILGHMYITTFLTTVTACRLLLPCFEKFGIITRDFLFNFHLIHFKHKGEVYKEMCAKVDKVSYFFTLYLTAMMVVGLMLFNVSPNYNNFKAGAFSHRDENMTLEFAVYYVFPGFRQEKYFLFTSIFNFYISYACAVAVCTIDLLLSLMVFQIIGHVLVLRKNLENLPKPKVPLYADTRHGKQKIYLAVDIYDANENEAVHIKLTEFVNHHRFIVSFTDVVSNFFGPTLAIYYAFHLVSCCLLLLECSTGDPNALARYGPLTIIIFGQLIQISIIFEVVGYVSEKLIDSVYLIPWECMNVTNMRVFIFFLTRVQRPIRVTAMGMTPVGVQTMAGILKTTFSYFTFLKSKNQ